MTHTPGPWEAIEDEASNTFRIVPSQYGDLAQVYGPLTEARADARLIAAAPELLEALQAIEDRLFQAGMPYSDKDRDAMKLVALAITKATKE